MRRGLALLAGLTVQAAAAQETFPARPPELPPVLGAPAEPAVPVSRLPERVTGVPGTWDLSRDGTPFRCVMTLAIDSGAAGRKLFFPAGCRRALPITATVAGWLHTEGGLRLVDKDVRPLLVFTRRPDQGSLVARAENGVVYSFVPLDIAAMRPAEPGAATAETPAVPDPASPPVSRPESAPVAAADASRPEPGLYALDRYRDRDVCRLDLGAAASVRILPGCRDNGIEVFDPVAWSFAAGRLTLKAKRGHTFGLVPNGEGGWRRDPETGTTFVLRRVAP